MKTTQMLFLSLFLLSSCGSNNDDSSASPQEESSNAGKVSLWTRPGGYDAAVFLPATYGTDPDAKYPMVLSLHGFNGSVLNSDHTEVGGQRTGFIKQVWDTPLALTYPGIVVAPDVYPPDSNENSLWNREKLVDIINDAIKTYQVDPNRITVTGNSAGAIGAQQLALVNKNLIAGIMPGAFDAIMKVNTCSVDDLPIWSFGNSSDVLFQPASWTSFQTDIQACSGYTDEFTLTIYQNQCGHDCWDDQWKRADVQEWLVNQSKTNTP